MAYTFQAIRDSKAEYLRRIGLEEAIIADSEEEVLIKQDKKKTILHLNGKDYLKCDQCGNLTDEIPCKQCGGTPIKDLDALSERELKVLNKDEIEPDKLGSMPKRDDLYFHDGGVSILNLPDNWHVF